MPEEFSYLEERVEKQQEWHSKKATHNKRRFYFAEIVTIVAGALIPVINVFDIFPENWLRISSTILASIIVAAASIGKLYKYQENWLNYRAVSETLKREEEFYQYEIGEYDIRSDRKRNKKLVERVESILSGSTSQFISIHSGERDGDQNTSSFVPPSDSDSTEDE